MGGDMNTQSAMDHLSHDELLKAVVDMEALSTGRKDHLAGCTTCSHDLERLHNRFANIGRTAKKLAPAPARPFRLPASHTSPKRRSFKPVWVMAFSAAMLLAIVVMRPNWLNNGTTPSTVQVNAAADRELMKEIDALVDDALPVAYQQLAYLDDPFSANGTQVDKDLLDWVVPPIDDDGSDESLL